MDQHPAPTPTAPPPTAASPATARETHPTDRDEATIESAVSVHESGSEKSLRITGTVRARSEVVELSITVGDSTRHIELEPSRQFQFDESVPITGGRSYEVTITAETLGGDHFVTQTTTEYIPTRVDGLSTARLVGAHYYPWYEMHDGHEDWIEDCIETPVLGEYAADDSSVIDRHLTWCLNHGIHWLSVSWWGEGSGTDRALASALLEAKKFEQIQFSILYETTRLSEYDYDLDNAQARRQLREDLQYLDTQYFAEDNYLYFDERPVVFFWVAHNFSGDVRAAFEDINASLERDIYLLAGLPFGQSLGTAPITAVADGITSYNPYSAREDIKEVFHDSYERGLQTMNLSSRTSERDFVPVVIPGFNDTVIPDSQRADNPVLPASPSRYEQVCQQAKPHLADSKAVLITSFNEWYENTQIEPSERFGASYLETTAEHLATGTSDGFEPTGFILALQFNQTVVPAEVSDESTDTRELAFMADRVELYADGEQVADYDIGVPEAEPIFLQGAFSVEVGDDRTWRWLGGVERKAALFIQARRAAVDRVILRGQPMRSNEISATISIDGEQTESIDFGQREMQTYEIDIGE